MESSDDQTWVKKTKKQIKASETVDVPIKIKKKKKKTEERVSDEELVKNNNDFAGKNIPHWLEITDSEEEFAKPEKGKNKMREDEGLKTVNEWEESPISPFKKSLKKKKKAAMHVQVNGDGIFCEKNEEAHLEDDMIITKASSKKRKAEEGISGKRKKKRDSESSYQKVEVQERDDVHEEYSSPKKNKKIKRNDANHEDSTFSYEHVPEVAPEKPGKEKIEVLNEEQVDDDDHHQYSSLKKGKKTKRKDEPAQIMDKNHVEITDLEVENGSDSHENVPEVPKKQVKRQTQIANEEQEDDDGEEHSSLKKGKKTKRKEDGIVKIIDKNHVNRGADLLGDDEASDGDSPKHVPKESPKKPAKGQNEPPNEEHVVMGDDSKESSPKKSKKKRKEDELARITQKNHVDKVVDIPGDNDASHEDFPEHVPKGSPKKSVKEQNELSNEEQVTKDDVEELSSPKKSKKKQKENEPTRITHKNHVEIVAGILDAEDVTAEDSPEHVPEEPPKKPVKRQTKVPNEEQVTVGDEYKMKTFREKSCKNCDATVKLKMKTAVRNMGTQTQESAVLNWIVGRKVKKRAARVRKSAPVSRKDRIILPTEGEESFYATSPKKLPLSKELMLKLRNMKIKLKEDPLPQHNVGSNNVCRPLSEKEKEEFEKYEKLRIGNFDPAEDEIIVKNWKKFCKKHDWDVKLFNPFTVLRYRGAYYLPTAEQRRSFVQFLARGLPNRCLTTIHKRFKTLFSTHRTERYTPEEDQMILNYIESRPDDSRNNFNDLAEKLNRTRASIWRRYKILISEKEEQEAV